MTARKKIKNYRKIGYPVVFGLVLLLSGGISVWADSPAVSGENEKVTLRVANW